LPYAFSNGPYFVAVGMFDFQIEQDAHHAREAIRKAAGRARVWA